MTKKEQDLSVDALCRTLVRRNRSAALATALTGRRKGWPYASLVSVACTGEGSPLLLLSTLADHTRNLEEDNRASLLFEEASSLPNPQTGTRVTLTGRLNPTTDKQLAQRFLARHPGAKLYAGFADFGFFRMKVERAHYVGGFGRANWLGAKKYLYDTQASEAVAEGEQRLVKRLNGEQADIISRLAGKNWLVIGIDPEGIDLIKGNKIRRYAFLNPARSVRGVGSELRKLTDN